jgi:MoaA/NifB/PqqE/SkfB family radical SAM enzyme
MEACLIVTYRCNAHCRMCHTWHPSNRAVTEFQPDLVDKLPADLRFINITGGEPFLRKDLDRIIEIALTKTRRLIISTNGFFTRKILGTAKRFGNRIGLRISLEGLPAVNDHVRGIPEGFDRGLRTLLHLREIGISDIGFGVTVSDWNIGDVSALYQLAKSMGVEFATAVVHNSFYFHKFDNALSDPDAAAHALEAIAIDQFTSARPKNWFRAYFNMGLVNRIRGGVRPLPCDAGTDMFFLDPRGRILPCNGSEHPLVMGDLHKHSFAEIWSSPRAKTVRRVVCSCSRQCWMIGSAAPAMKRRILIPLEWIIRNKWRFLHRRRGPTRIEPVSCGKRQMN